MKIVSKASILERQQNKILLSLNLQTSSNTGKTHWTCKTCNLCFLLHQYVRFTEFIIRNSAHNYQSVHQHIDHVKLGYYKNTKYNTSCVLCNKIVRPILSNYLNLYYKSCFQKQEITMQKMITNNNTYTFDMKDNSLHASLALLFDSLPSDIYIIEIDDKFYQNYPRSHFANFQPQDQMKITIYNESHQPTHNLVLCR